jgi:hypothetical protein
MAIAAGGIAVLAAGTTAAVASWPAGASTGAATTADFLPGSGHGASEAGASRVNAQVQAQVIEEAHAQRVDVARAAALKAAARKAAARKAKAAAAKRAAAERAAVLAAQQQAARQQSQPATSPPAPPVHASGSAQQIAMSMLGSFGWSSSQFSCLDSLWMRESGWSVTAENPDGAYGIPQAMPGSKMASAGSDWETDAATQIRWGLGYIKADYGSPCGAWSHEEATGWY